MTPTTRFGDSVSGYDWNMGYDHYTPLWEGDEYKKLILRRALLRRRPDITNQILDMMSLPQKDQDIYNWSHELGIDVRFADPLISEMMRATGVAEIEPFIHFISANNNEWANAH